MTEEWTVVGVIGTGLAALIIALTRGWLLTPNQIKVWETHAKQWERLYTGMENDRDYWRNKAERLEQDAQQALDIAENPGGDTHAP